VLKSTPRGKRGLKGALEEKSEGSKALEKEMRAWKRPKNDDQRLEGAFEGR
jgi:hypothetical protein